MYNPWRRTTNRDRSTEGVELFQPYGYRQASSNGSESGRGTTKVGPNPSAVKLLPFLNISPKPSEDRASHSPLPKRNLYDRLSANSFLPSGWRAGALGALIGAIIVLILNLAITIWVAANPNFEVMDAVGTMYRGNCAVVRNRNVWIHLLVNVLSTLLLCGSNYVMQVLAAPNREDIDRAHAQRRWLHIGVPNLRNLRYIRRDRVVIYALLFLSSVPLHLFFNSVVFTRLQSNMYFALPTTADWIEGAKYNYDNFIDYQDDGNRTVVQDFEKYRINLTDTVTASDGSVVPKYQNLSSEECFNAYDSHYVSDFGNVYLVQSQPVVWRNPDKWELRRLNGIGFEWARSSPNSTSDDTRNNTYELQQFNYSLPFRGSPRIYPSNIWRCESHAISGCDSDNPNEIPNDRSQWSPYGSEVKYCLAERVEEYCELQFSFAIAIVVITANLVKAICIAFTLFKCKSHEALVTIGDAIASFLSNPDPTTIGRCLQTRRHVELWWDWNEWAAENPVMARRRDRRKFRSRRRRWAMAPSEARWVATYWSYGALVVAGIALSVVSMKNMPTDPKKLWATGFGAIQGNNLLKLETSLLGGVLLANTPQALLSYMYLAFNALYTTMFISAEWASYSVHRKPLRVTEPVGQQRSTYWLGVPYRYAIPVTIVSGLFHWLASQSLFKVQISVTDMRTRKVVDQISTCGYSPVAVILTMVVAAVLAGGGIGISAIRFPTGIPLVASNSAAISAGCHPLPEDSDASMQPVQWGAVHHGNELGAIRYEPIGHCCFSSFPVEPPIEGNLYT